ncbi:MAG: glycosyltransferase family 25 protein [bacterium]|nr:glycosyltransferase family 25 protein [bacterium]
MKIKNNTLGFDKIYVINLKRRLDRKTTLIKENPNLDFTFIEAIDGKNLIQKELLHKKQINTSFFDPSGMVTMGVFACALSHKKAWDQALIDGVENALFLEDDIFLPEKLNTLNELTPYYQDIFNEIQSIDYDILFLGKKSLFQEGINVGKYLTIPRYNSNHNGAHAYVVNKKTIQDLSDNYLPIKYAADVYLEQFYNTHKVLTLKKSIIRQVSDIVDPGIADSDTFYNDFREGGGRVGISFDEEGNVINKRIAQYLKHPKDTLDQYTEIILSRPKFGIQNFNPPKNKGNNVNFFSITKLLNHLSENLSEKVKMVEINSHLGENSFFFGCSGLFSNIYSIDPYKGKDKFNIENNITWEDIKIGFHSNTYIFEEILNHLQFPPEKALEYIPKISFLYINNRKKEDISNLINLYLPKIKNKGFIGGNNINDAPPNSTIYGNNWIIEKEKIHIYNKLK